MAHDLKTFLKPHCVAIIGASRDASKRGNRAIQMLLDSKFAGRIVPINPKESEILSLRCYPDLASVPFDVDLALVCTPASAVGCPWCRLLSLCLKKNCLKIKFRRVCSLGSRIPIP